MQLPVANLQLRYSNRTVTAGYKICKSCGKKANRSSNQGLPGLASYALTIHPPLPAGLVLTHS